jgi:hypothetical protein
MDFVVALDQETMGLHPAWQGQPVTALWDYPHIEGGTKNRNKAGLSAVQTLMSLQRRIDLMVNLQARGRTRADLQQDLRDLSHV